MDKRRTGILAYEDYWAIIIGIFLFSVGLGAFYFIPYPTFSSKTDYLEQILHAEQQLAPYKTVEWHQAKVELNELSSAKTPLGATLSNILRTPKKWDSNPFKAFYKNSDEQKHIGDLKISQDSLAALKHQAEKLHQLARQKNFEDASANESAALAAKKWRKATEDYLKKSKANTEKGYNLLYSLLLLCLIFAILFGIGASFMGFGFYRFVKAFFFVFSLAVVAHLLGQQADMKNIGFGYAIWAIAIGMLISNTLKTPEWVKPAVNAEFYIKTGLVLLGAQILLNKILAIGLPGIFVSWIVTPIVLVGTFWFGQHILKIASKSLNIVISADMSVCGVSAAIATAAASKASKEELTVAVGLSMVFTSVMMIALPAFIKFAGIPEVLGAAWIGGTIDASGAVVAAGAFLGETALHVAATIKMIQNMLIGVISFFVAYYWATRVEKTGNVKVGPEEIWKRFPKFILGFLGTSIIVSVLYAYSNISVADALIDQGLIRGFLKSFTSWFFALAFVSIGLSININELKHHFKGGKPMYLYLTGQTFNLGFTLLVAYLMFYVFFPEVTEKL